MCLCADSKVLTLCCFVPLVWSGSHVSGNAESASFFSLRQNDVTWKWHRAIEKKPNMKLFVTVYENIFALFGYVYWLQVTHWSCISNSFNLLKFLLSATAYRPDRQTFNPIIGSVYVTQQRKLQFNSFQFNSLFIYALTSRPKPITK